MEKYSNSVGRGLNTSVYIAQSSKVDICSFNLTHTHCLSIIGVSSIMPAVFSGAWHRALLRVAYAQIPRACIRIKWQNEVSQPVAVSPAVSLVLEKTPLKPPARIATQREGYDIPDARYGMWLSMYHPEAYSVYSGACQQLPVIFPNLHRVPHGQLPLPFHPRQTILSKLLDSTNPVYKLPGRDPKNSARVLTSSENLQMILVKKRQKEEEAKQKK